MKVYASTSLTLFHFSHSVRIHWQPFTVSKIAPRTPDSPRTSTSLPYAPRLPLSPSSSLSELASTPYIVPPPSSSTSSLPLARVTIPDPPAQSQPEFHYPQVGAFLSHFNLYHSWAGEKSISFVSNIYGYEKNVHFYYERSTNWQSLTRSPQSIEWPDQMTFRIHLFLHNMGLQWSPLLW